MESSKFTIKLLWIISVFLLIFGITGWYQAFSNGKKLRKCSLKNLHNNVEFINNEKTTAKQEFQSNPINLNIDKPSKSPTVSECLKIPGVQRKIKNLAGKIAKGLSSKGVEDYKEEEKSKKSKRYHKFLDTFETAAINSVNIYAKKYDVSEEVTNKLHGLMESGFKTHREVYESYEKGEISRKESRKKGAKARKDDIAAVIQLLGEDEAKDFWNILKEESKKEFAKKEEKGE
jgi:hypothetical protein